jgi:hypothetical protein
VPEDSILYILSSVKLRLGSNLRNTGIRASRRRCSITVSVSREPS